MTITSETQSVGAATLCYACMRPIQFCVCGDALAHRWLHDAVCRAEKTDPELFSPPGWSGRWAGQVAEAKQVCARCPVTALCVAVAYATGDDATIRGGLTPDERRTTRQAARLNGGGR